MQHCSLSESYSVLQDLPQTNLLAHVKGILDTEPLETQVIIDVFDRTTFFSLFLVTKNTFEKYWNMYLFHMDQVEKEQNQYRHYSFSFSEAEQLHKNLSNIFENERSGLI